MTNEERMYDEALRVVTLYYYQGLNTERIAKEMKFSRPKVSKLLNYARVKGLVEIKILDNRTELAPLEQAIKDEFGIRRVHIISVPDYMGELVWLERAARYAANYLNSILQPHQVLGIAWGTTISEISEHLIPKRLTGLKIVQLNGSANTTISDNRYAANIIQTIAANYQASVQLFPVPGFFDYKETKDALWRERSIRAILDLQQNADVLLYSIGAVRAGVPSRVYSGDFLEPVDLQSLREHGVVGDIATVFYRADGSWDDIPLNHRASGPPLNLYTKAPHGICVVSGLAKVKGLYAALKAGYMTELIIDEPSANYLVNEFVYADGDNSYEKALTEEEALNADSFSKHRPL
jgi:deoxyribonucleoside regulator